MIDCDTYFEPAGSLQEATRSMESLSNHVFFVGDKGSNLEQNYYERHGGSSWLLTYLIYKNYERYLCICIFRSEYLGMITEIPSLISVETR